MSAIAMLQGQVLSVAAKQGRTLELKRTAVDWTPAVSANGAAGPVLVLGALPAAGDQLAAAHLALVVADPDAERLRESLLALLAAGGAQPDCRRVRPDDLRLDLTRLARDWETVQPATLEDADALFAAAERRASETPAIADESFAVIYCADPRTLAPTVERQAKVLREAFRVLARGGVARFAVELADEPADGLNYLTETGFLTVLEEAGFYGIRITQRSAPVAVRDGLEFRTFVVEANRGKEGPCLERYQAAVYLGPWKKVYDDDGHVYERGARTAVCDKTFTILTSEPYRSQIAGVEPYVEVPLDEAGSFDCAPGVRSPADTKSTTRASGGGCCEPSASEASCCEPSASEASCCEPSSGSGGCC
jgi:SAM-dependent methyltransferase